MYTIQKEQSHLKIGSIEKDRDRPYNDKKDCYSNEPTKLIRKNKRKSRRFQEGLSPSEIDMENNSNEPLFNPNQIKKRNMAEEILNLEEKYKFKIIKKRESVIEDFLIKEQEENDFELFIENFAKNTIIEDKENSNTNTRNDRLREKFKNNSNKSSYNNKSNENSNNCNSINGKSIKHKDLKITNFFNKKRTFSERCENEGFSISNNNSNNFNNTCSNNINNFNKVNNNFNINNPNALINNISEFTFSNPSDLKNNDDKDNISMDHY